MTPAMTLLALALITAPDGPEAGRGMVRDLLVLAGDRPVIIRLRMTAGDRPFDAEWPASVRPLYGCLDRDGDGKLKVKEADPTLVTALVRLATAGTVAPPRGVPDTNPKDGVVSIEELAEAIRPTIGPFRVQFARQANGRPDDLFDHVDRDKNGQLTRSELTTIAGTLRRFDVDDDEMISLAEIVPFSDPSAAGPMEPMVGARSRLTALPSAIETATGDSSLRMARLLLRKYDKGGSGGSPRPDGRLSSDEFAVEQEAFAHADRNGDGLLDADDLRRYLAGVRPDIVLEIAFPDGRPERTRPMTRVWDGETAKHVQVRRLDDGDLEFAVGRVRIDIRVDDGEGSVVAARNAASRRFRAADSNKNGYLEGKELTRVTNAPSPFAGLTPLLDRDADGRLLASEFDDFVNRQIEASRGRLVLTVSDQGRAIFRVLDLDRDRRLGAREVARAAERVMSWDGDSNGSVTAEEIPYHVQLTISRSTLPGLTDMSIDGDSRPAGAGPAIHREGPDWFRLMDRNRDGDVSHREFLGPREQFDRFDRDHDGLIEAGEADQHAAKDIPKASRP